MHVSLVGPDQDLQITGITCRGGVGTMFKVSAEAAPAFADLPAGARKLLEKAKMVALRNEDRDLLELTGENLYEQLGPLRKA